MSERQQIIAATLRQIAEWGDVSDTELYEIADQVENGATDDWWSCPMCEEITCDDGCPLEPLRRETA